MARIDKLIQQLKQQIQKLQAQLQVLENESSDGAEKQQEGLRQQLGQLMGALQDSFNQKIKLLEQELGG